MNLLRQKFILLIILTTFFVPFTFSINVNIDSKIKQPAESAAAFDQSSEEGEEETTVTTKNSVVKEEQASCDVFDSFKVLPSDPGHFQIGGAFPLHTQDCLKLKPSSVQDVVAIQWAMAYWNEQTNKMRNVTKRPRIGLFAGDSCSRPKEAISQSLRFLDAVGFHDPTECLLNNKEALRKRNEAPRLIAVLSPKDSESANSVAQALKPYNLPIAAFSSSSAQALLDQGVTGFISTAPLLFDYAQTLVELLKLIGNSNLVSIVDNNEDSSITDKFVEIIRQLNISISEIISVDHPNIINVLNQSDAQIIVSLVNKNILATIFNSNKEFNSIAKLWVSIDWPNHNNGEGEDEETLDFINQQNANFVFDNSKSKLKFISIHRQQRYLADFNAYFLRVLVSNHEHYSLLNAYVRTVYNCNKTATNKGGRKVSCENDQLNPARLAELHRQSASLESIIPLIFALARTAQRIDGDSELSKKCQTPSQPCFDSIRNELLELQPLNNSQLGIRLPPGFSEQLTTLRFFQPFLLGDFIQMEGIVLEAVFRENSGSKNIYKLIEYKTGASKNVRKFQLPSQLSNIHSYCRQNRPYCLGKCEFASHRKEEQTFLSLLPQNSPLYIAALFDFQSGTNCNILRRDNPEAVSLPLAFLHAISTFQQQFSPKSGLFTGADSIPGIGALLIDTCSNTKNLLEFLIDSERNCYKFTQMERNWTIANGATIGYLYGSEEELTSTQEGIFDAIFSNPTISPPLLTLGQSQKFENNKKSNLILSEFEEARNTKNSFFHLGPSHKNTAIALAKFLKKMHWTYVNVVVDKSDSTSVSLYNQFMLLSTGICTSDVILIGDQQTTRFDEHNNIKESEHSQTSKKKRHDSTTTKTKQSQHLQTLLNVPNANVTLAAEFMSARLRDEFMASGSTLKNVHIMIGEAHDFYLRDPTNLVQYAGTVSFQAKDLTTPEFHSWIRSITPLTLPEVWYWRHVEENWQCALSKSNIERFNGRLCTGEELLDVNGMGRLTRAGYLTRGIQLLLEAIDSTYKKLCPNEIKPLICDEFNKNGRKLIRNTYAQLILKEPVEYEIYQLVSNGDENNFGYKLFANYSSSSSSSPESTNSDQIHFISEYRPFITNSEENGGGEEELQWLPPIISRCRAPFCKCPSTRRQVDDNDDSDDTTTHHTYSNPYIRREPAKPTMLNGNDEELLLVYDGTNFPEISQLNEFSMSQELNEALRIVFFVLSGILCVLAMATLLLILFKMYQRTIKGHQSLGILLLIGICSLYATGFLFASTPSNLICHLRISAHSLAHTLCFGVIIVKAIQLKNAETLATSSKQHTISYWNYWLLLAFIFAVQFVICMKWFLIEPLEYIIGAKQQNFQLFSQQNLETQKQHPLILLCSYSSPNFLLAQIYTFFLLLLALLLSSKNRSIKRNYKEAKWLFITSLSCTIILCLWAVSHVLISPVYLDFTTVIELQLTATLLLIFIFGPKLYVLLFYEPVVVECFYSGGSGQSLNRDSKTTNITSTCSDLFETSGLEWNQHSSVSPTPSTTTSNAERSSSDDRERETIVHNNDEKAFQTILRKKNNSNKLVQNNKNNKTLETTGKMLNKNTTSTTTK